ncbi:MAG TPA: DUF2203 domain-containing protein [Terriglobales bacterium]|nr:DUF2203 domain-containing protein [Terriglobales bacterium]
MSERYFTPDEVEALIPMLTRLVEQLREAHERGSEIRARMDAEHTRLTQAGGGMLDQARWRADAAALESESARAKQALDAIHGLGGVPKDLAQGLVDFPHVRDGRVVNLCWKHGETRIRYWHGMDEGFSARKPL